MTPDLVTSRAGQMRRKFRRLARRRALAWSCGAMVVAVLAVSGAPVASAASGAAANACVSSIRDGRVGGGTEAGVCAFEGIPYAAPPVGTLRFRPPAPVRPWRGVLAARRLRSVCPQDRDLLEEYPDARKRFSDENCLYLNVWTPRPDRQRRPVMVFIPGGAFVVGSASEPIYDGALLAARGNAVIVTLNYRLGILGWLELGRLNRAYAGSGNNGLRDELAALQWVQNNIRAFGGDPRNVTVFGESAGAISVSALLAIDRPERYFHRAILESGGGYLVHTRAYAQEIARRHFQADAIHSIAQLKRMSANQLLDLQNTVYQRAPLFSGDTYFAPFVDGQLLPGPVVPRVAAGSARHIQLLSGTNENETEYWVLYTPALYFIAPTSNPFFPSALSGRQAAMIAHYRANRPGAIDGAITHAMLTDQLFRVPQIRLAEAQARWQRHDYMYWFRWHVPYEPGLPPTQNLGAIHGIELGFVFGNLDLTGIPHSATTDPGERAARRLLANRMMDAWLSFARSGNPSASHDQGVPSWPTYDPHARATMAWNRTPRVLNAPGDDERALWADESFDTWDFTP